MSQAIQLEQALQSAYRMGFRLGYVRAINDAGKLIKDAEKPELALACLHLSDSIPEPK